MKRFSQTLHRCFLATALGVLLTTVTSPARSGRPQSLASPNAVPESLGTAEWSSIRQQIAQQRRAAVPVDGGYQVRNTGQQWETRFDGRGFTTKPDGAAWQWGLELISYGLAGSERTVSGKPSVNSVGQRVTYEWDTTLQEWFVNDVRGLEHGFTVRERPTDQRVELHTPRNSEDRDSRSSSLRHSAWLTFTFAVRGGLRPEVQLDGGGVHFMDAQGTTALTYSELTVLDADGQKLPARFETVAEGLRLAVDERDARYPLTIDPIAQQAYLTASNPDPYDQFGISVAISGDTVVVGARGESSSATGVDGDQSDNSAENSGAAYVFVRDGTNWTQQAYLKASNPDRADSFGYSTSVAISGDTVVVAANHEDSSATGVDGDGSDNSARDSGAVYVFVRTGTNWNQQAYLKASNTGADDNFGYSVAVSGDTLVVGAGGEYGGEDSNATGVNGNQSDDSAIGSGAAYVFVRSGTTWSQQSYLKASNTAAGDGFGRSVAVSGDTLVVGAGGDRGEYGYGEDSNATGVNGNQSDDSAVNSGAAYVFVRNGTNWSQQAYLKASNTGAGDGFGYSVAVSGDTLVVGAGTYYGGEDSNATGVNGNQSNSSAVDSGAAYVFVRTGTNWNQQAYLKASNTGADDGFGYSVAVSGDTVAVGALLEDSSARGVNGNQSNNNAQNSGATYVFVRKGTNWTQQAYLKAANSVAEDFFGCGVAVSGDTVVSGGFGESSNGYFSGATYVFTGLGIGPQLAIEPDSSSGYSLRFTGAPDVTYRLQRAPIATGPWSDIATNTAPASGLIEYRETSPPPGAAFYRTAQP